MAETKTKKTAKNPAADKKPRKKRTGKATDRRVNYLGKAGELRVASELSLRGYITHMPAVDEGGDLFAVHADTLESFRLQVKTCATPNYTQIHGGTSYLVNIKGSLLKATKSPIYFILHCVHDREWWTFVFSREELVNAMPGAAPTGEGQKSLYIGFHKDDVKLGGAGGKSIKARRDAWGTHFPALDKTGVDLASTLRQPKTGAPKKRGRPAKAPK